MSTCVCLAHSAFQGDPDFGIVSGEHKRRRQFSKEGGGANLRARNYEYRRRKVSLCFLQKGLRQEFLFQLLGT